MEPYSGGMDWHKAPKEPSRHELFSALGMPVLAALIVYDHRAWWVWVLAAFVVLLSAITVPRWIRQNREYRAWTAWDEAGGPDATSGS